MTNSKKLRIAIAGDRMLGLQVIRYLIEMGDQPTCLLLHPKKTSTHGAQMRNLCPGIPEENVFYGKQFRSEAGISKLKSLGLDFLISVHFHYVFPEQLLHVAKHPTLNLHPAYLPYNRGWHTPTWAILDDTPFGATLHIVENGIDTGDIIHQKKIDICGYDTANTLYQKGLETELEVFQEIWPQLREGNYKRVPQSGLGTEHSKKDLVKSGRQHLNLDEKQPIKSTLRLLRALTTNDVSESAYFHEDGNKYSIRIEIQKQEETTEEPPANTVSTQVESILLSMINQIKKDASEKAIKHLRPEQKLQEAIGLDSLQLAELTVMIEAHYGVDVFVDGIVSTVGEIVDKIKSQTNI